MWIVVHLRSCFFLFPALDAEKRKSGDLARGANHVNFVIFPFPLRVTHLMVRLQLPYERHVSKMSIYVRTRRPKKSDSLLLQLNVVHILSLYMGASNPCVEVLGMPRALRTDYGWEPPTAKGSTYCSYDSQLTRSSSH